MDQLKQCPFCGAAPKMEVLGGQGSTHRVISCTKCKCDLHWQPTEEMSIAKWNQRASEAQVKKAFDMIASANTVTILSLGEMESIVNRALNGEFQDQ